MRQPMLDTVDEYFTEAHVRAWALWWGSMSRMPVDDQGAGLNVHALIVGRQRNSWVTMVGGRHTAKMITVRRMPRTSRTAEYSSRSIAPFATPSSKELTVRQCTLIAADVG